MRRTSPRRLTGHPEHRKAFECWLGQNRHRFNHPPRITLQRKDYLELSFRGVTPQIKGFICKDGTSFHIWHAGQVIDMLNDIDIVVAAVMADTTAPCASEGLWMTTLQAGAVEQHWLSPCWNGPTLVFRQGNGCTLRCAMAAPVDEVSPATTRL